jgi:hypothetical protein
MPMIKSCCAKLKRCGNRVRLVTRDVFGKFARYTGFLLFVTSLKI